MTRAAPVAAAALAALCLGGVCARADETTDDVRCFIVAIQMAGSEQPDLHESGLMGQLYWMGKLDGRTPGLNFEDRVMAELPRMTGDFFRVELTRCTAELSKRGLAEAEMGRDIQKRGADNQAPASLPPAPAQTPPQQH